MADVEQLEPLAKSVERIEIFLNKYRADIAKVAAQYFDPDRQLRIRLLIAQNPDLGRCTPISWLRAAMTAASVGLEPDGVLGRAFIIPYKNEATFQFGYQGLLELARRSDEVADIDAHVVRQADQFAFEYGLKPKLTHIPAPPDVAGELSPLVGVYAIMWLRNGRSRFRVMWKSEIERHRKVSKANSPAWAHWYEAMARKTVLIQVCEYGPKSPELRRAIAIEKAGDLGTPSPIEIPVIAEESGGGGDPKGKLATLTDKLANGSGSATGTKGDTSPFPPPGSPKGEAGQGGAGAESGASGPEAGLSGLSKGAGGGGNTGLGAGSKTSSTRPETGQPPAGTPADRETVLQDITALLAELRPPSAVEQVLWSRYGGGGPKPAPIERLVEMRTYLAETLAKEKRKK